MSNQFFTRQYSGNFSRPFWKKIKNIQDNTQAEIAYAVACLLQETEERILSTIEHSILTDKVITKKSK